MNENELYVLKEYLFDKPFTNEIDSIIDSFFKDYHNKYFHKFKFECIYDIKLTNITDNEINSLTISGKSMNFF